MHAPQIRARVRPRHLQKAVHDDIDVAAYRGGEVRVVRHGKCVVRPLLFALTLSCAEVSRELHGLGKALQQHHPQKDVTCAGCHHVTCAGCHHVLVMNTIMTRVINANES